MAKEQQHQQIDSLAAIPSYTDSVISNTQRDSNKPKPGIPPCSRPASATHHIIEGAQSSTSLEPAGKLARGVRVVSLGQEVLGDQLLQAKGVAVVLQAAGSRVRGREAREGRSLGALGAAGAARDGRCPW